MKMKMRWMAVIAALLASAAACDQMPMDPAGAASLEIRERGTLPQDTLSSGGYFGSGHVEPPPPPTDSIKVGPEQ